MDYDLIANLVNKIKFYYVQTGDWNSKLCQELLEITGDIPVMVCKKRGISMQDTPDLIQKSLQDVFRNLHTIKDDRAFPRYLFVTVDHLCQKYWRKLYQDREISNVSEYSILNATYRLSCKKKKIFGVREDLRELIDLLPEKYREVIELFYFAGYTSKEISEKLQINMNTITSRLRRGRNRLREMLEE